MILVLKSADFSANNLGQVEVTTELNPFTLAAIAASGNTSLTDVQKSALDTFFKKVGAFGSASDIWSKLQKVFLPILAGAVGKAAYNYAASEYDAEPTGTSWQLRNKGIVGTLSSMPTSGADCLMESNITSFLPKVNNLSSLFMVMEEPVSGNTSRAWAVQGDSGTNRFSLAITRTGAGSANLILDAVSPSGSIAYDVAGGVAANAVKRLVGISISGGGTDEIDVIAYDGLHRLRTNALVNSFGTTDTKVSYAPFSNNSWQGISKDGASVGMVFIGTALTSDEMTTLKNAADTLAVELTA